MEISGRLEDGILIVKITGRLDSDTVEAAAEVVEAWLGNAPRRMAGDLSGLYYISSAGLQLLVMMAKRIAANDGRFSLFGLQDRVREIFNVSGFDRIVTIAGNRADAVALLSRSDSTDR